MLNILKCMQIQTTNIFERKLLTRTTKYTVWGVIYIRYVDKSSLCNIGRNSVNTYKSDLRMIIFISYLHFRGTKITWKRYRDWGTLRYALRSVEKNADWLRHVYIVTNGQIPSWLNTGYHKVSIIKHSVRSLILYRWFCNITWFDYKLKLKQDKSIPNFACLKLHFWWVNLDIRPNKQTNK